MVKLKILLLRENRTDEYLNVILCFFSAESRRFWREPRFRYLSRPNNINKYERKKPVEKYLLFFLFKLNISRNITELRFCKK